MKSRMSIAVEQKEEERDDIEIVDCAKLVSLDHETIQHLVHCAKTRGFLYLANHGVSQDVLDNALSSAYAFFDLPNAVKHAMHMSNIKSSRFRGYTSFGEEITKGKRDLKETLDIGLDLARDEKKASQPQKQKDDEDAFMTMLAPNPWAEAKLSMPSDYHGAVDELSGALDVYVREVSAVGDVVMSALAKGLGLQSDFFEFFFRLDKPDAFRIARCCYYPAREVSTEEEYGIGPHTDVGTLVLLHCDNRGLQAQHTQTKEWIDVPPRVVNGHSCLVLNFGDVMERWTDGNIRATPHRVINQTPMQARMSLPVFYEPNLTAEIYPLSCQPQNRSNNESQKQQGEAEEKECLHYGKHVFAFFQRSFPDL